MVLAEVQGFWVHVVEMIRCISPNDRAASKTRPETGAWVNNRQTRLVGNARSPYRRLRDRSRASSLH